MPAHNRKIKLSELELDGVDYAAQCTTILLVNNTPDPEVRHTHGGAAASFSEESDPDWTLQLNFYNDYRSAGITRYLLMHDGEEVDFTHGHLADIVGEHIRGTGRVQIKAASFGGEARQTDAGDSNLRVVGKPTFTPVG